MADLELSARISEPVRNRFGTVEDRVAALERGFRDLVRTVGSLLDEATDAMDHRLLKAQRNLATVIDEFRTELGHELDKLSAREVPFAGGPPAPGGLEEPATSPEQPGAGTS